VPVPILKQGILHWLGPIQVLAIHLPLALLISAAVAELWLALRGSKVAMSWVRYCILFEAPNAVMTATLVYSLARIMLWAALLGASISLT
jgi:hypothetical protein